MKAHPFEPSRRTFLKTFGGGLAVLWFFDLDALAQTESGAGNRSNPPRRPVELAAWLHIAADGTVTAFTGKTEVGQNIRTSLTQAIAEELPTPLATIRLVMADTALTPWDAGTFGSRTTPEMGLQFRRVAATAREALLDLAAKKWSVDRTTLTAANGKIFDATQARSIGFGELTEGKKLVVNLTDTLPLKPASAWSIAGTSVPRVDGRAFVTGKHLYTPDLTRPGMMYGRVMRAAMFGGSFVSLDTTATEALPGVRMVRDGLFTGVVAATDHLAAKAIAALRVEWKPPSRVPVRERDLFTHLRAQARGKPPTSIASGPDASRQTYTVSYIAHTPLEPRAALAEWTGERLTVWTGTQRPFGVRSELAQALRIPEERVRVIVPDTGSAYGGKHTGETAVEAARLALAIGKPVKLVWTREEEFTWAYFRPAGVIDIASQVDANGVISHWEHFNYNSGDAGLRSPYEVAARQEMFFPSESPLRQGSYRALAATANHFARETHLDEIARAARLDPLELRLKNLTEPRARAVLEAAVTAFGWNKTPRAPGHGFGLAFGTDKGGTLATCAEVSVDRESGKVTVVRVVQAFECGAIVHPEHLKSQNEGAIVQGIGGALFEAIHFDDGKIANPHLAQYRVPRFSDLPKIEIVLLDRKDLPSAGAGEAPIIGIAPAIGNAIFDATGVRLRSLPLAPHGLKA